MKTVTKVGEFFIITETVKNFRPDQDIISCYVYEDIITGETKYVTGEVTIEENKNGA